MDSYQYLILMAACVAVTLPLEFVLRARVYRRPVRLLLAMAPMLAVFVAWDLLGIVRGHWTYSERFTSGIVLGILPLEELVFFLVIPLCGLLTYEGVGYVLGRLRGGRDDA
ncbi:lycopene cyclase [Tessaracoccus aquimaris]|uniref:Lycopene cyclase n=1 Tax=Tessaracoccus aquimaris TaxID=1332264 RepID=A0A1Q2CKJ0_9ACTN|nr:lycopene cyclase domain-containing protein [Tessaracoccus aquimaris]AQP46613.1 lycopene cyclase [Tessaracoccus aquimaris]